MKGRGDDGGGDDGEGMVEGRWWGRGMVEGQ